MIIQKKSNYIPRLAISHHICISLPRWQQSGSTWASKQNHQWLWPFAVSLVFFYYYDYSCQIKFQKSVFAALQGESNCLRARLHFQFTFEIWLKPPHPFSLLYNIFGLDSFFQICRMNVFLVLAFRAGDCLLKYFDLTMQIGVQMRPRSVKRRFSELWRLLTLMPTAYFCNCWVLTVSTFTWYWPLFIHSSS